MNTFLVGWLLSSVLPEVNANVYSQSFNKSRKSNSCIIYYPQSKHQLGKWSNDYLNLSLWSFVLPWPVLTKLLLFSLSSSSWIVIKMNKCIKNSNIFKTSNAYTEVTTKIDSLTWEWGGGRGGEGRDSTKFYTGRLQPQVPTLTLLCPILTEKVPLSLPFNDWKKAQLSLKFS